jgi:hypothetical protein
MCYVQAPPTRKARTEKILPASTETRITVIPTEYLGVEVKRGGGGAGYVSALSAGTYTSTLYVMVNIMKGGGRAPAWANFSIMMECTPECGRCHSVYSAVSPHPDQAIKVFPRRYSMK